MTFLLKGGGYQYGKPITFILKVEDISTESVAQQADDVVMIEGVMWGEGG